MPRTVYEQYPELENERTFTPAEVSILAGVSTEKQRQYRFNGFTNFLEMKEGRSHSRYTWEEVTLWAIFGEVASCGFTLESAGYFAASVSGLAGSPEREMLPTSKEHLLYNDYRVDGKDRSVPLYLLGFPRIGDPKSFINTATHSGSISLDGTGLLSGSGRFGFWINYSDFQRRLLLRYESIR